MKLQTLHDRTKPIYRIAGTAALPNKTQGAPKLARYQPPEHPAQILCSTHLTAFSELQVIYAHTQMVQSTYT